jgi:hypothetical protein
MFWICSPSGLKLQARGATPLACRFGLLLGWWKKLVFRSIHLASSPSHGYLYCSFGLCLSFAEFRADCRIA